MAEFSHFDEEGASRMVDVGDKPATRRYARASGRVVASAETLALLRDRKLSKGDAIEIARVAGIMAAKRTSDLIPLCHPLSLDSVKLNIELQDTNSIAIEAEVTIRAATGVEMEALTAVSIAALTIYDMCKSVDRSIVVEQIRLEEKQGGESGHYVRGRESSSPG